MGSKLEERTKQANTLTVQEMQENGVTLSHEVWFHLSRCNPEEEKGEDQRSGAFDMMKQVQKD